jgi:riboflavin synthase
MFTGIVERVATVDVATWRGEELRLDLATGWDDLALGESVAVNGICLTVVDTAPEGRAGFFVSGETLARSNLGQAARGAPVNLERAVTLATRLSGHLVQGHVDGVGRITGMAPVGDSRRLTVSMDGGLRRYCVDKGSIALDGVSLTINETTPIDAEGRFSVSINLIPHTWDHTRFRASTVGDAVNVEVDLMAKYVERLCLPSIPHASISR